jgi:hypothetical protein
MRCFRNAFLEFKRSSEWRWLLANIGSNGGLHMTKDPVQFWQYVRTHKEKFAAARKHSFRYQAHSDGVWGTVTSCDRAGFEHNDVRCFAYLQDQALRWHASGYLGDAPTRIICTEGNLPKLPGLL